MPITRLPEEKEKTTETPNVSDRNTAKPYKVAFYYPDFGNIGGIERYILTAALALKTDPEQTGIPWVICTQDGWLAEQCKQYEIPVSTIQHRIASPWFRIFDIPAVVTLWKLLREEKPDIGHLHIGSWENIPFLWQKIPTIFSFHGYAGLYQPRKNSLKPLFLSAFKGFLKHVNLITPVSQAEEKQFIEKNALNPLDYRFTVTPNAINRNAWKAQALSIHNTDVRKQLDIPVMSPIIGFFGRCDHNKNPLAFIEIAETDTREDSHYLLVGTGPLDSQIVKRLHRSPIKNRIHWIPNAKNIGTLMNCCDVILHLASQEGFGYTVLEAMTLGIPTVCKPIGGLPELLGEDLTKQYCLESHEIKDWQNKVQAILSQTPDEKQHAKQALTQRSQHFDIVDWEKQLQSQYQNLLPPNHPQKTQRPFFSVILAAYNAQETIENALSSVLSQTYKAFELIIVNDGSTDQTGARIGQIILQATHPHIRVVQQTNQGVAIARNNGFEASTGTWVAWIDADDSWEPNKLETMAQIITQIAEQPSMLYSHYTVIQESGKTLYQHNSKKPQGDILDAMLSQEGLMLPSTTVAHRNIIETIGGFDTDCYHEDRAFFIRASQQFPAYSIPKSLVRYQQSSQGRCRSILSDFQKAHEAELSIVETLQAHLSLEQSETLRQTQLQNLLCRFLMYGNLESAETLAQKERISLQPTSLKKALAWLSLKSQINLLQTARQFAEWKANWGIHR